ncbi:MAG: 3-keto-5-aminohexanoate cleavage protein [Desulfobacteraceae bacterium]|nr:MAG: 3-keto-5-aminohexanoate cleavage protein [Desulfobacteraceae bacterium]
MRKVMITAALTGGFHGKETHPGLPEQPDEIAQAALECYEAGASIAHIHARDKKGKASPDVEIYREIKKRIRDACDIVLSFTTGGGPNLTPEERIQSAFADPEICSLNMGTMVRTRWGEGSIFLNTRSQIEQWARILKERGIKPELEVYGHSMMVDVENLIQLDLLDPPYFVNIVLGMTHQGAMQANEKNLLSLIEYLPPNSVFNVTAMGRMQLPLTTLGVLTGGNPRVGLEDNIYYHKGVLAESNAQLVARAARMIRELDMEVATPKEAREILRLNA